MAKKSKYEEALARARKEQAEKEVAAAKAAEEAASKVVPDEKLTKLLAEANNVMQEIADVIAAPAVVEEPEEDLGGYATKEQKEAADKVMREVLHPESKKAYNIYFDMTNRYYYMDVIEYDGTTVLSIKTERLTVSQAVAMAKVQKLFTEKLILRKKGV